MIPPSPWMDSNLPNEINIILQEIPDVATQQLFFSFCQNTSLDGKHELSTILDLQSTVQREGGRNHSDSQLMFSYIRIIFQHFIKMSEYL